MDLATNILVDVPFPGVRRDGSMVFAPLSELLSDPDVEALASGHPYIDLLANNFIVCVLQTTMTPRDGDAWKEMLLHPPSPEAISSAFSVISHCFDLADPANPFMQVRFDEESRQKKKPNRGKKAVAPEGDDEDEGVSEFVDGTSDLSLLLPDETSANQRLPAKGGAHFSKYGRYEGFGAFVTAMVLYGANMVSIGGGGGYYAAGVKSAAFARIALPAGAGITFGLWRSAWLNVAAADHPKLLGCLDEGFRPETVFGWVHPDLRRGRGKAKQEDADFLAEALRGVVTIEGREVPYSPFSTMWGMARRCELAPPAMSACSMTGQIGATWAMVELSPGGPRCPLRDASWHPLLGISLITGKNGKTSPKVNKGPSTGIFRAVEWSSFFPTSSNSVADMERAGAPPSVASLLVDTRRDALSRILREGGHSGRYLPCFPVTAVAIRQDKVLDGWSEGSIRLWSGGNPRWRKSIHSWSS